MKRLILLSTLCAVGLSANAQISNTTLTRKNIPFSGKLDRPVVSVVTTGNETGNKGTGVPTSRWYNAAENTALFSNISMTDFYGNNLAGLFAMWQDSTVRYTAPNNNIGINFLSFGQMFHPQSTIFNDPSLPANQGQMKVSKFDNYTVDSIQVWGQYSRTHTNYVDTLLLSFVNESGSNKFAFFSYGGTVGADHGIDSFAAMLYSNSSYMTKPITQTSYTYGSVSLPAPVIIKVPLTNAVFADSVTSGSMAGTHKIKAPVGITVPAGGMIAVSVTFKSGTTYTAGSQITNYNYFALLSHETVENGFVAYPQGDLNMSSVVYKDSDMVSSTLSLFQPAIAWTEPFGAELHNIAFKVSCTGCAPVSVANVNNTFNVANAYPNPANNQVTIPVTMKADAAVAVTLSNLMGQVVATQNLGKVAAKQTGTATFNTATLPAGMYLYTVHANGDRQTGRVSVSH